MYCTNCGNELSENVKFCPLCGNACTTANTSQPLPQQKPPAEKKSPKQKKSKFPLVATIILIAVSAVGAGAFFLTSGNNKANADNTTDAYVSSTAAPQTDTTPLPTEEASLQEPEEKEEYLYKKTISEPNDQYGLLTYVEEYDSDGNQLYYARLNKSMEPLNYERSTYENGLKTSVETGGNMSTPVLYTFTYTEEDGKKIGTTNEITFESGNKCSYGIEYDSQGRVVCEIKNHIQCYLIQ